MNHLSTVNEHHPSTADDLGLERIIFFSDAVFAIAITLLVLDIRLPETGEVLEDNQFLEQFLGMWHDYLAYFISFWVIGTAWMGHHRKFRYIKRYNSRLMTLNLFFLMIIAFIPFPSSIISKYSGPAATIIYALTMFLLSLLMTAIWGYASWHHRLIVPDLDSKQIRRQFIGPLATSLVFLFSIVVALFDENLAKLLWLLILFISLFAYKD
ncbi:MAG: TMEM175 family protein [Anaerolineales bacterium]|jgi:uncharacterized membrane protein